jgi:hypothetical protein
MVIKGEKQGQGKNTYFILQSLIYGKKYVTMTSNLEDVFGKFGNARVNKLLIGLNEVEFKDTSNYAGRLKDAITEPTFSFQLKNKDIVNGYPSFDMFFLFSNKNIPVLREANDRRYFICDVDAINYDTYKTNIYNNKEGFFNCIYSILGGRGKNPNYEILRAYYDYFIDYYIEHNIKSFNFEKYVIEKNKDGDAIKCNDYLTQFFEWFIICEVIKETENKDIIISNVDLCNKFNKYKKLETGREDKAMTPCMIAKLLKKFDSFINDSRTGAARFKKINIENGLKFFKKTREEIITENLKGDFIDDNLKAIF